MQKILRFLRRLIEGIIFAIASIGWLLKLIVQVLHLFVAHSIGPYGFKLLYRLHIWRATDFFHGPYLHIARAIEDTNLVTLQRCAQHQDLDLQGNKKMTLLWFAIQHQNLDAIRTLVACGAHPDKQHAEGIGSALDFCFKKASDTGYLQAILEGGFSANFYEKGGPLMLKRAANRLAHVKVLLDYGARLDDRNTLGQTALYDAYPDVALYLIQRGAAVNIYDDRGISPAWGLYLHLQHADSSHPWYQQWVKLQAALIEKGVKWPPDSPEIVREHMRQRGENVVIPTGLPR